MKNVKRTPQPESLRKNGKKWTKELLKSIEDNKKNGTPIRESVYNRYNQDDVKDALKLMYGDEDGCCYCCYCESQINVVSYPNIEHRKPKAKKKFPELTYDWDNLHIACEICNRLKGDKYDKQKPILDAVCDKPITKHLGYKLTPTKGVYRQTKSKSGITTVKHAQLDRRPLRMARLKVYNETMRAIEEIKRLGDDPRVYTEIKILQDMFSGQYGSLIEYLIHQWNVKN